MEVAAFADGLEAWLSDPPASFRNACEVIPTFGGRVAAMQGLMADLFAAGWGRYGWPEAAGGLGGSILHRAVLWEALARHGLPGMELFEHLEVLAPTLVELGPPAFVAEVFPRFLSGEEVWSQGFSEPGAGSDLAALRTRADAVEGGWVVNGRKIWTSWSKYATWCLLLARTGTPDSRHRGITAMIVDLRAPGVEVSPIVQANGTDELAEVAFTDVFVPADRLVGELDGGWAVAMHILSSERGTYGWFRHGFLYRQLLDHATLGDETTDVALGNVLVDLAAVSAVGLAGVRSHEAGIPLGPRATFAKLLLCAAEQSAMDWLHSVEPDLAVGVQDGETTVLRQHYLFSRIVTVYGGSQQMQLETIAKQLLRLP